MHNNLTFVVRSGADQGDVVQLGICPRSPNKSPRTGRAFFYFLGAGLAHVKEPGGTVRRMAEFVAASSPASGRIPYSDGTYLTSTNNLLRASGDLFSLGAGPSPDARLHVERNADLNIFKLTSSAAGTPPNWTVRNGRATTTDATVTTINTIAITSANTYYIEAIVTARRTGGSSGTADDGATYKKAASYTTKSGTVTLLGAVRDIITDNEDQAAWDVTFVVSGTNVLVRVTGAANNNITWHSTVFIKHVGT